MPHALLSTHVRNLPSTLEVLKLDCINAHLALINHDLTEIPYHGSKIWNISSTFPSLKVLSLLNSLLTRTAGSVSPINSHDMVYFPESLIELRLHYSDFQHYVDFFTAMPRKLRIFETQVLRTAPSVDRDAFSLLPPGLVEFIGYDMDFSIGGIPPTMEHIPDATIDFLQDLDQLRQLPPKLRTLRVSMMDSMEYFKSLPRELEEFRVELCFADLEDAEVLRDLPPTLRTLEFMGSIDWNALAMANSPLWPDSLQTLITAPDTGFWDPNAIKSCLPKNLTELRGGFDFSMSSDDLMLALTLLPPSLTSLECKIDSSFNDWSPDPLIFPHRLQSLTINIFHGHWIPKLPPSLTFFKTDRTYGDHGKLPLQLNSFPTTLKHLEITWLNLPKASDTISIFCHLRDLRSLKVRPTSFHHSILAGLSQKLETIEIELLGFSEQDIPNLPRNLRYVNFGLPLSDSLLPNWPEECAVLSSGSLPEALNKRTTELENRSYLFPDPRVLYPCI